MRRNLIRKLKENKIVVIIIGIIIVCIVYFATQEAIDNYIFNNNDIIEDGDFELEVVDNKDREDEESDAQLASSSGQIDEEEIDLVLSEDVSSTSEAYDGVENEVVSDFGGDDNTSKDSVSEVSKIYVYITGEVNNPGVVVLNEGSRIVDAINSAGGTTIKADVSKVNLVYVLDDGMKVNIPNNNDLKNNPDFEYITMNSGDGGKDDYSVEQGSGTTVKSGTGGDSSSSGSGSSKNYSVVNINTATQTELETLPGIGPSLAMKIIKFRKENGDFSSIDEIKNVSGIGDNKFEELKNYITV